MNQNVVDRFRWNFLCGPDYDLDHRIIGSAVVGSICGLPMRFWFMRWRFCCVFSRRYPCARWVIYNASWQKATLTSWRRTLWPVVPPYWPGESSFGLHVVACLLSSSPADQGQLVCAGVIRPLPHNNSTHIIIFIHCSSAQRRTATAAAYGRQSVGCKLLSRAVLHWAVVHCGRFVINV